MRVRLIGVTAAFVLLGGCMMSMGKPTARATAELIDGAGAIKGTAAVVAVEGGLHVTASVARMTPGTYGIHLHQAGTCTPPDFASAGSHWNPAGKMHGSANPMGPHAGDLPNIVVNGDGRGTVTVLLTGDFASLMDADGAALVIHAKADDYKTDPSGNSGARMVCGVLKRA